TAFWMMFFDGYIGAPPTLTVFSDMVSAASGAVPAAKASAAAAAIKVKRWDVERFDMGGAPYLLCDARRRSRQSVPAVARFGASSIEIRGFQGRVSAQASRLGERLRTAAIRVRSAAKTGKREFFALERNQA